MAITSIEANGGNGGALTQSDRTCIKTLNGKQLEASELAKVRQILAKDSQAWKMLGDMNAQIRFAAIDSLRENVAAYESICEGIRQMRKDLRSEGQSATECMLIEHVLTCWLQCAMLGRKLEFISANGHSIEAGSYWDRRYSAAHARFLRSLETLGRIRKLKLPTLQVNIGEKQINVAGSV